MSNGDNPKESATEISEIYPEPEPQEQITEENPKGGKAQAHPQDEKLRQIAQTHDNPFILVAADNVSAETILQMDVEAINRSARQELLSSLNRMKSKALDGKAEGNEWLVVVGDAGSGKTHLLKWLENETKKMGILYVRFLPFVGKGSVEYYLVRNLLDELRTRSFPGERCTAIRTLVFPLFQSAIQVILGSGDPNWAERICRPSGWLGQYDNSNENRKEILLSLESQEGFDKILSKKLDAEKLANETINAYKVFLPAGISEPLKSLLELSLCRDEKRSEEAFNLIFQRDDEEDRGKVSGDFEQYKENRLKALLTLFSLGKQVICLSMDQFEETYTKLKERNPEPERLRRTVESLFTDLAKLFNYGKGLVLVMSCQMNDWTAKDEGLARSLPHQVMRRIKSILELYPLSLEDMQKLVKKRLDLFWEKHHLENPPEQEEMVFPFTVEELRQALKTDAAIGIVLKEWLGKIFEERMEEIRTGRNIHFLLNRGELVKREEEARERARRESERKKREEDERRRAEIAGLEKLKDENEQKIADLEKLKNENDRKFTTLAEEESRVEETARHLLQRERKLIQREENTVQREIAISQREEEIRQEREKLDRERQGYEEKIKGKEEEIARLREAIKKLEQKIEYLENETAPPRNYRFLLSRGFIHIAALVGCLESRGLEPIIQGIYSERKKNLVNQVLDSLEPDEIVEFIEEVSSRSDLANLCRRNRIPAYGTKRELIERILDHASGQSCDKEDEE